MSLMPIKIDDIYESEVLFLENEGAGVCKVKGITIFVPKTLVGEKIRFRITEIKKNYARGKLIEIISPSPDRTESLCPYYEECGGCDLRHQSDNKNLEFKRQKVQTAVSKIGKIDIKVEKIIPSFKNENYRNKASFKVEENRIGFYGSGTYQLVDINYCRLLEEEINNALSVIRKYLKENKNDIKEYKEYKEIQQDLTNKEEKIKYYNNLYTLIPEHLSVSDIKSLSSNYLRKPYFLNSNIKSTNKGTLYHKIFELLPIKKYSISSLKEEIDKLNIHDDEKNLIDIEKIFAYLTSDLYDMILNSDFVYKEKPVLFYAPSSYYDDKLKEGNVLLDGIIDLLFIKDDCYYIVDYKTDNVEELDELKNRYQVQLDLYEIAVKETLGAKKVKKFIYSIKLNKFIEV